MNSTLHTTLCLLLCLPGVLIAQEAPFTCRIDAPVYPDETYPTVVLETSAGEITVELDRRKAPVTVNNFLRYVESGRYDGTQFHRVVADFAVQGGGYMPDGTPIETEGAIMNESGNGLGNNERTIAMARLDDPHSASSQFYFNLADNDSLNPNRKSWGYTVFGTVIDGWDVVQAIAQVDTGYSDQLDTVDVPVTPVVLRKATLKPL